jgi:hypothetical protein
MNQVKTINELINRTWRAPATALALTLFVFLFGTNTARAQGAGTGGGAGKVAVHDVGFAANVSVARGQIVRITFLEYIQGPSLPEVSKKSLTDKEWCEPLPTFSGVKGNCWPRTAKYLKVRMKSLVL